MIVHKTGSTKQPPAAWWEGLKITCHVCDTEFELEDEDNVITRIPRIAGSSSSWSVLADCPVCKKQIETIKGNGH